MCIYVCMHVNRGRSAGRPEAGRSAARPVGRPEAGRPADRPAGRPLAGGRPKAVHSFFPVAIKKEPDRMFWCFTDKRLGWGVGGSFYVSMFVYKFGGANIQSKIYGYVNPGTQEFDFHFDIRGEAPH